MKNRKYIIYKRIMMVKVILDILLFTVGLFRKIRDYPNPGIGEITRTQNRIRI